MFDVPSFALPTNPLSLTLSGPNSRGAYTARALAGMLHFVGLLPRDNIEQVSFAYKIYKSQSSLASSFRRTFCRTVEVKMLGLW